MRAGAAVSRAEDVRLAARDAATRALDAAGLDEAACLVVAATPEHLDEAVELCEALRDAAGANAQIVGGATSAVLVPGDAEMEEGPALGVLALAQRAELFSFRSDAPDELRAAAQKAGPGALGIVFADPEAPVQRLLGALGRVRVAGGGVAVEGGPLLDHDPADAPPGGAFFPAPGRAAVAPAPPAPGGPARPSPPPGGRGRARLVAAGARHAPRPAPLGGSFLRRRGPGYQFGRRAGPRPAPHGGVAGGFPAALEAHELRAGARR